MATDSRTTRYSREIKLTWTTPDLRRRPLRRCRRVVPRVLCLHRGRVINTCHNTAVPGCECEVRRACVGGRKFRWVRIRGRGSRCRDGQGLGSVHAARSAVAC